MSKYSSLLWSLLPPGAVWQYFAGKLSDLFDSLAENFQESEDRRKEFLEETRPETALETLPEWEASYGLETDESAILDTRRAGVVAKRKNQGITIPDYLELVAPLLACTADDLQFIEHSSQSQVDRLHPRDVFIGRIYRDPALPGTFDLAKAQTLLDQKTQAHLKIKICESLAAQVDDPFSLVDRDLMAGPGETVTVLAYRREDGTFLRREDGDPLGRG